MSLLNSFSRLSTKSVNVGNVAVGGNNPIRIQSMTSTDTLDIEKTVEQSIRMISAGCEIVRITVPNMKAVSAIEKIKNTLRQKNINVPLVADVHFSKNVAEAVAPIVEKVRINPGNYLDKKQFVVTEYTNAEYANELERIEEHFTPLVEICKRHQTAMRIGTNHGSLSDRIINRYGDSPIGMVQSALEFIDICEKNNFDKIVLSMKSSNTLVMTAAYRLLVGKLEERGVIYPFHLGVTEAGSDEDGRVKSAVGIGTLLSDGIGDTIRVSLTEDPEKEIPVCQSIVEYINLISKQKQFQHSSENLLKKDLKTTEENFDFLHAVQKKTTKIGEFGEGQVPKICTSLSFKNTLHQNLNQYGYDKITDTGKWIAKDIATDLFYVDDIENVSDDISFQNFHERFDLPLNSTAIIPFSLWQKYQKKNSTDASSKSFTENKKIIFCFDTLDEYLKNIKEFELAKTNLAVKITINDLSQIQDNLNIFSANTLLILESITQNPAAEIRNLILHLRTNDIVLPCMMTMDFANFDELSFDDVSFDLDSEDNAYQEKKQIYLSLVFGPLLIDNLIQGIYLKQKLNSSSVTPSTPLNQSQNLSILFAILQATRRRISRTEYISCPSCGRTLFDLQEVTTKIRKRTEHLKGVKIGIMGCIVNGPGEMADADFGYVGSGVGKITLYKGKEVIKRGIPSANAIDELIQLIKDNGAWVEPEVK